MISYYSEADTAWLDGSEEAYEEYVREVYSRMENSEQEGYPFDAIDPQDADDVAESYEELLDKLFTSNN